MNASSVRLRYAAAFATVALWSTATVVAGVVSGRYAAFGMHNTITYRELPAFVFMIVVFGLLVFAPLVLRDWKRFSDELRATDTRTRLNVAILGLLIPGYMLAYYYALMFAPPLNAYVIIYLWPIFLFMFSRGVPHNGVNALMGRDSLMLILAFVGAALVVQENKGVPVSRDHLPGYLAALLSAVLIAATFRTLTDTVGTPGGRSRVFSKNYHAYFSASLLGAVWLGLLLAATGGAALDRAELGASLWLGAVVFGLAHLCWTYAIGDTTAEGRQELSGLTALVFMTPVSSALLLYAFFGETVTAYTVLGIALVILGNLTVQSRHRYINAAIGASAASLVIGIFCYFTKGLTYDGSTSTMASLLATVFAIIISFTLTRLSSYREKEAAHLWSLGAAFSSMWRTIQRNPAHDAASHEQVRKLVDRFLRSVVDIDFGLRRGSRYDTVAHMKEISRETQESIRAVLARGQPGETAVARDLNCIDECTDQWLDSRFSSIHFSELAASWLLGILTTICLVLFRGDSLAGDVFATFASPVIVFLLLALRDYSSGRVERDMHVTLLLQQKFQPGVPEPYLPGPILASRNLRSPGSPIRIRSSSQVLGFHGTDDPITTTELEQLGVLWKAFIWSGMLFATSMLLFILVQKHR